jgi:dsDNA-binding SOS-regulon protein
MAVESRFVVIRKNIEVQTFMDKKAADEYDKMLDMADSLSEMFEASSLTLDESMTEELSIYLAQHRDDVLVALQAKKPKPVAVKAKKEEISKDIEKETKKAVPKVNTEEPAQEQPKAKPQVKAKVKAKTKAKVD